MATSRARSAGTPASVVQVEQALHDLRARAAATRRRQAERRLVEVDHERERCAAGSPGCAAVVTTRIGVPAAMPARDQLGDEAALAGAGARR